MNSAENNIRKLFILRVIAFCECIIVRSPASLLIVACIFLQNFIYGILVGVQDTADSPIRSQILLMKKIILSHSRNAIKSVQQHANKQTTQTITNTQTLALL